MKHSLTTERENRMLHDAFGPVIQRFFSQEAVIELMVNPDGKLWVESLNEGKYDSGETLSEKQIETIIKLVAAHHQLIVNREHPELACELPESHCRFQGWFPPVVTSACFTIRKHLSHHFTLNDYVQQDVLTEAMAKTLRDAVLNKKNIIIAGGTGSGKTTLANALLNELNSTNERVIILEDLPEIRCQISDCVRLRTSDTVSMRDLVKGVLRMRPDRIIIGEVRDGAALELLKAWNTGHPGGICTLHANSLASVQSRLEDLVQEAIPVVPHRLLDQVIDMTVFTERDDSGCFKIMLNQNAP